MDISESRTPLPASSHEWPASCPETMTSSAARISASAGVTPGSSSETRVTQPSLRSGATSPTHEHTGPSGGRGYLARKGSRPSGHTHPPPAQPSSDSAVGIQNRSRAATQLQDAYSAAAVTLEAQAVPDMLGETASEPDAFKRALRERAKRLIHREGTHARWLRPESARVRGTSDPSALPAAGQYHEGMPRPAHEGFCHCDEGIATTTVLFADASDAANCGGTSWREPLSSATSSCGAEPGARTHAQRLHESIMRQMRVRAQHWSVSQVCDLVEHVGLPQYRRHFLHHVVDGQLMLSLTSEQLKKELGIGPLGHRQMLLESFADLRTGARLAGQPQSALGGLLGSGHRKAGAREPPRPASARDPTAGMEARQRQRLLRDLERAQTRAAQRKALAVAEERTAALAAREVALLQARLQQDTRRRPRSAAAAIATARHSVDGGSSSGLDQAGLLPWQPTGRGLSGLQHNSPLPQVLQPQRSELTESGDSSSPGFLQRLESDMAGRERRLAHKELQLLRERAAASGVPTPDSQHQLDIQLVREHVSSTVGQSAVPEPDQALTADWLDATCTAHKAALGISEVQAAAILKLPSVESKAARLAACLRALHFLERYSNDLIGRDVRLAKLAKMTEKLQTKMKVREDVEAEDYDQCITHFKACGWPELDFSQPGLPAVDARMAALLQRALASRSSNDAPMTYDDGLAELEDLYQAKQRVEIAVTEASSGPHCVDSALATGIAHTEPIPRAAEAVVGGEGLHTIVELLAQCHEKDIAALKIMKGRKRCVAIYRAVRTQAFLRCTARDLEGRQRKHQAAVEAFGTVGKTLSKAAAEAFMERLAQDATRRSLNRQQVAQKTEDSERLRNAPASKASFTRPKSRSKAAGTARPASSPAEQTGTAI